MSKQLPSNEQWALVQRLFEEMLEQADPQRFIEEQRDEPVRDALKNLWRRHRQAEKEGFLDDQITVVKQLPAFQPGLTFQPGQILAERFSVLRVLGSGGMGEVYLADDRRLGETVALKTVKAELGKFPENRARFLDEVRRARQVTHPNVCRIFDVFEHGEVSFYSMEYLAGATLAEVLAAGEMKLERARQAAVQVAEGLSMAHKNGVLHCDLKPANIILTGSGKNERAVITDFGLAIAFSGGVTSDAKVTAGTPFYMAPELLTGASPSVRSDVYAFGKVLNQLLPGHRLVARCTATDPEQRPASMELVLKELRGTTTRRTWLLGSALAAAGMGAVYLREHWQPKISLGARQRVRVNGFSPDDENAKAVRTLLMMALRQSPLLNVEGDRGYRIANSANVVKAGFSLPLADLLSTAKNEQANLAIDGRLLENSPGLKLFVTVYDLQRGAAAYSTEVAVPDRRQLVHLAELAAKNLRAEAFGESAFHAAYRPLDQITSSSTAAVDLYFRAVYQYEQGDALAAQTLLDQALAVDPDFALAHHYKALALGARNFMEGQQLSAQRAFDLRARVTQRERNWIESEYFNSLCDWPQAAEALRKNTLLFPDEAVFERQLAFALARLGRYDEAVAHNRRAVELDPFSENNAAELLMNLAEADRLEEFFAAADRWRANGGLIDQYSLGEAYLQQGHWAQALREFAERGNVNSQRQSSSRIAMAVPLILSGRFLEAIASLEGDLAWDAAKPPAERDETRTYMRRAWLGELYRLKDRPQPAAAQAEFLVGLRPLACNLIALREGALLAIELKETRLAEQGLAKLSEVAARWPSQHSQGAVWLTRAALAENAGETAAAADLYAKAKGVWPDPLNLFFIARAEGRAGFFDIEWTTLKELERLRGKVYRLHFSGFAVLSWLEQARCLGKLSLLDDSLRMYDRVAEYWSNPQAAGALMRQAALERKELQRRLA